MKTMTMMKKIVISIVALQALVACASTPQLGSSPFKNGTIYYQTGALSVTQPTGSALPLDD